MSAYLSGYRGLTGDTDLSIALKAIPVNSVVMSDVSSELTGKIMTNGQILVGSAGALPVPTVPTGSASIIITPGPGTLSIDTIQPLTTTSSPTFNAVTLSSATANSLAYIDNTHKVTSATIANANGCSTSLVAGNLISSMTQDLSSTGNPSFSSLNLSGTLSTGASTVASLVSSTSISAASGNISGTISAVGITSSSYITSGTNPLTGGATSVTSLVSSGSISAGTSSMTCGSLLADNVYASLITASAPVRTDASHKLTTGAIDLTSEVTGVLPVANGGTGISPTLTGGKLMVSTTTGFVEGTSSSHPTFTSVVTVGSLSTTGTISGGTTDVTNLGISSLTPSMPVKTSSSAPFANLISGAIGLATADVTGILPLANGGTGSSAALIPIASGGTNSGTALTSGKLMASVGGAIVEGTSSTDPVFHSIAATPGASTAKITMNTSAGNIATIQMVDGTGAQFVSSTGQSITMNTAAITVTNTAATTATLQLLGSAGQETRIASVPGVGAVFTDVIGATSMTLSSAGLNAQVAVVTPTITTSTTSNMAGLTVTGLTTVDRILNKNLFSGDMTCTTTTIAPNTWTQLAYSSGSYSDPAVMYGGTNNWVIPTAGRYEFIITARLNDATTTAGDTTGIAIYKGISPAATQQTQAFFSPDPFGRRCGTMFASLPFARFDVVSVWAYQASASSIAGQYVNISIKWVST